MEKPISTQLYVNTPTYNVSIVIEKPFIEPFTSPNECDFFNPQYQQRYENLRCLCQTFYKLNTGTQFKKHSKNGKEKYGIDALDN